MIVTNKMISDIFKRAEQYCVAKYGTSPDYIKMYDGDLVGVWTYTICGQYEEDEQDIDPNFLTADLEEVYNERKIIQAEKEKLTKIEKEKYRVLAEENAKKQRLHQYQLLKKEFDNK